MRTMRWVAVAAVVLGVSVAQAEPLKSPWDAKAVTVRPGAYSCPAFKALPKDIAASDFYTDAHHSVIDVKRQDAYKAAEKEFQDSMAAAEKAADEFQATGKQGAADCVLQILDTEAAGKAMTGSMSTNQANYVQNWTLGGFAVSWLKVRGAKPGTEAQRAAAVGWMDTVGKQVQQWFSERHNKGTKDGTNNHYYWAGFAAAGAAIAADDRGLYDWGVGTYGEAISRIGRDGTLPLEMDRAAMALHYHLFALAPIVMLAEYGEVNGQHLYSQRDGAVHRLIERVMAGMKDPSYFEKAAGATQTTSAAIEVKSNDVLWLVPYLARFPNAEMSEILKMAKLHPDNYMGGLPPAWSGQ